MGMRGWLITAAVAVGVCAVVAGIVHLVLNDRVVVPIRQDTVIGAPIGDVLEAIAGDPANFAMLSPTIASVERDTLKDDGEHLPEYVVIARQPLWGDSGLAYTSTLRLTMRPVGNGLQSESVDRGAMVHVRSRFLCFAEGPTQTRVNEFTEITVPRAIASFVKRTTTHSHHAMLHKLKELLEQEQE
jgi:hypothetical protein